MKLVFLISIIIQALSVLSGGWMIIDIMKKPRISSVKKFLLWIAIGNLISGVSSQFEMFMAFGPLTCISSMIGEDLGQQISITSATALGVFAYKSIADFRLGNDISYAKKIIIITLLLSIVLTVPPLFPPFFYSYGYDDECTIFPNTAYSITAFFEGIFVTDMVQLLPFLITSIMYYAKLIFYLRKNFASALKKSAVLNVYSLFWYPCAQFVSYLFYTENKCVAYKVKNLKIASFVRLQSSIFNRENGIIVPFHP